MMNSKGFSFGLAVAASVGLSSCAYVNYSKGMVVTDSSHKGRKPTWMHSVTLTDPPVDITAAPSTVDRNLSAGPCILLPLAVIPNPFGIYSAIWKRKRWEIPDKNFRVRLDFWGAGWHHNSQKFGADAEYKVRPQEFRLQIGEELLSPVSVEAHCYSSELASGSVDCPPPIDGAYSFHVSASTVQREPQYDVTFNTSAAMIEKATLLLGGISRNDKPIQSPALEIARRRFFTVGCVLGGGSEWYYFTH